MKVKLRNKLPRPISIGTITFAIFSIIFTYISRSNGYNQFYSIIAQVCSSLAMLLLGIVFFVYRKAKVIGSFLALVFAYELIDILCVICGK